MAWCGCFLSSFALQKEHKYKRYVCACVLVTENYEFKIHANCKNNLFS